MTSLDHSDQQKQDDRIPMSISFYTAAVLDLNFHHFGILTSRASAVRLTPAITDNLGVLTRQYGDRKTL